MSLDDEIRQKKQSMQAAVDAEAKRAAEAERLRKALDAAGMHFGTPIIRMPSEELRAVIAETMPRMTFKVPKIIRKLPDGTTRARYVKTDHNQREQADEYSFDVVVKTETFDKTTYETSIWFFKNGSVAFVKDGHNIVNPEIDYSQIREKIIEAIANDQVVRPKTSTPVSNTSSGASSGGCYIATAVYGSYDCSEVWTLRRFRDYVLQTTWYGRAFIKVYYAAGPSLVRFFGNAEWFQRFWRRRLDSLVTSLQKSGLSDKPYDD